MAADRWHGLLDAIQSSNMSAADTAVYRFLLDKADYDTTELPPKFTPTRKTIGRKTRVSLRQVHYSIGHLEQHRWLTVTHGHKAGYVLLAGTRCDCTGRVHVGATEPEIGATVAPILVQRIGATPQVNGQVVLRGTEREGEEERRGSQSDPPWADPTWPRWPDGRRKSFAETMEHYGQDPWS